MDVGCRTALPARDQMAGVRRQRFPWVCRPGGSAGRAITIQAGALEATRVAEGQGVGICRVVVPNSLVTPCGVRHWTAFGWASVSTASTDAPLNSPSMTVPVNVSTIWPPLVVTTPLTESVLCWPLFHLMTVVPGPLKNGCSQERGSVASKRSMPYASVGSEEMHGPP